VELHDEVVDWLDTLDDRDWAGRGGRGDRGPPRRAWLPSPIAAVASLGEGLFELRFTLGPTARRITSRFTKDGRIILSC
jgi:hypothetical protein